MESYHGRDVKCTRDGKFLPFQANVTVNKDVNDKNDIIKHIDNKLSPWPLQRNPALCLSPRRPPSLLSVLHISTCTHTWQTIPPDLLFQPQAIPVSKDSQVHRKEQKMPFSQQHKSDQKSDRMSTVNDKDSLEQDKSNALCRCRDPVKVDRRSAEDRNADPTDHEDRDRTHRAKKVPPVDRDVIPHLMCAVRMENRIRSEAPGSSVSALTMCKEQYLLT
ncbi:hypothetical protein MG293_019803 [Ovis ammon polii]|uniref:Uncharacterized protein n=1 Tax=Ovis ammon polii TaxID=230172 RepID=A0AAD4Y0X7_OVIAM|nr:hypothetical protein MG293_019803 [Ovis ammon polii]